MAKDKNNLKDLRAIYLGGTSILGIITIIWRTLVNVEITLSLLQYITLDQTENSSMIIDILLILIFTGIILGIIRYWYKSKDEELKQKHFIDVLKRLHEHQCKMSRYVDGGNEDAVHEEAREINSLLTELEEHKSFDIVDKIKVKKLLGQ